MNELDATCFTEGRNVMNTIERKRGNGKRPMENDLKAI